jgi:hypothetical protein
MFSVLDAVVSMHLVERQISQVWIETKKGQAALLNDAISEQFNGLKKKRRRWVMYPTDIPDWVNKLQIQKVTTE